MRYGVSYIVPVYNKADCIEPVLKHIRCQTGGIPSEYIFVDDGSTDGSFDLVKHVTRDWSNTIVRRQTNSGAASATNHGIELATMKYVKFVDADDVLSYNATTVLLQALHGSDACLAYGATTYFDGEVAAVMMEPSHPLDIEIVPESLLRAIKGAMFNLSQCLVRLDAVREVGGCDERLVHAQDYSLSLRLALRWSFLRVSNLIVFMPRKVKQRVSNNLPWQLQRVTRGVGLFLEDNPDIPNEVKRYAARRATGRAWKFARRERNASVCSIWFWRYVGYYLGISTDYLSDIERSCDVFEP